MKITLINPPITSAERYGFDIGPIGGHQAPLQLCYLGAFLEKNGYEVSIIDAEAERLSNNSMLERIKENKPNAVGITSTTVAFHRALSLAEDIKSYKQDLPIIIGGSHLSANPLQTLSFKYFDFGVFGEGEVTLCELLKAIQINASTENIQGVIYRRNDNVIINPHRPYINNLDSLPFPARHLLFNIKKYAAPIGSYRKTPVVSMITSRGCPYKCIFCDTNVFGHNIRFHSPEYVACEIETVISRYGAKEITFVDDTFTVDKNRVRKIVSLIRKFNIDWSCMTRADNITKELLLEMKTSGCWQICLGIESGNQDVLDFIKKDITLGEVRKAVKLCDEAGLYVKGFFILGHPIDTPQTINETIDFAISIPLSDIVCTIATPIPGTELNEIAPRYGSLKSNDWRKFSCWMPVFVPKGLSEELLLAEQKRFYLKFYLRICVILRQLKKIRGFAFFLAYGGAIAKLVINFCLKTLWTKPKILGRIKEKQKHSLLIIR